MLIDKKYKINIIDIFIGIFVLFINFLGLYIYLSKNKPLFDFGINRSICGYVLYGYNPIFLVGKNSIIESLGTIPYEFGNTPFGLLLGNLFYFGFLQFDLALNCFYIESIVILIITIYVAYKYFHKNFDKDLKYKLIYYFIIFSLFSINIIGPLKIGNAGHILCMLLIIAIFTVDNHKIISGICIALAMTKPQIALPVCISMLLYKKIFPLLVGASIDIVASVIASILVNENVIDFFIESIKMNFNMDAAPYFGIFSILNITNPAYTQKFSMLFGILLIVLCYILLKNNVSNMVKFSFPIIIASFWSYSWSSDHFILIIPCIVFMLYFSVSKNIISKAFFLISSIFINFHWYFKSAIRDYIFDKEIFNITNNLFYRKTYSTTIVYATFIIIMFISLYIINTERIDDYE